MKVILILSVTFLTTSFVSSQGYGAGTGSGEYEAPQPKKSLNIGFNLPAMSISLPKIDLPQISIKASVKNKKPFTLQLPIIKFNAHASTEDEDNNYGPQDDRKYPSPQTGGGDYSQPMQPYGPAMYASTPEGISAFANSVGDSPNYAPPQPSYGQGNGQYEGPTGQEPSYAGSGFTPIPVPNPQFQYQQQPQRQTPPASQLVVNQYQAMQAGPGQQAYRLEPTGYLVQQEARSQPQPPTYDENMRYYSTPQGYFQQLGQPQAPQEYTGRAQPANEIAYQPLSSQQLQQLHHHHRQHQHHHHQHNGNHNNVVQYGRRLGAHHHVERVGGVFLASSSNQKGSYVLAPVTPEDSFRWKPIIH